MVRHLLSGSFERLVDPRYHRCADGTWAQSESPHFPSKTWDPEERLENTFYTQKPPTAENMSRLIREHGGSGIVVSLLECMTRYAECAQLLAKSAIHLPSDPRDLKEWSLVMAVTGVLNAIDRGLLPDIDGCTIHASGSYGCDDFESIPMNELKIITNAEQMLREL